MGLFVKNNLKSFIVVCIFFVGIFIQSCDNEEVYINEVSANEYSLNLKSPSGEMIASDISSLKCELAIPIAEGFEANKVFTITDIKYLPLETGFSAIISYITEDGYEGNIVKTNNPSFGISKDLVVKTRNTSTRLKSGDESGGGGTITVSCKKLGSCDCKVTAIYKDGITTYSCGDCDSCEMTVEF
ncbi:hypothetical protein [uncultured Proteiniphilum sp.]|uniref:hypothetical protein n=1 Tax=uncultured Proteiniphilum sp. TaxID=497637 RepID=UPI002633AF8B|nr:hypothetical protein [uncultured Proteiniphilum sp.]